ncbi:MAG: beta-lactamase family protein [Planctomycetales bacterium]|nr:beta-lactamase family protein [Planctomycetales bacterium]
MRNLKVQLFVMMSSLGFALPLANAQLLKPALDIIEQAVSSGDIPGASVLILQNEKIIVDRAFGICDRRDQRAFQPDTICWIASLTKPITAAAAMTLVEDGKLDLDATVDQYLPEFRHQATKKERRLPTVRQLMCHSSGIQSSVPQRPRFFFDQKWYSRSLKEIAPAIAETELVFAPGTKVQYSNAAPYVLGRIIEVLSGQNFGDYVKAKILLPLGMNDTGFSVPAEKVDRVAVVYRKEKQSAIEFCRYDPNWQVKMTMPDGGLFSTPADMAKFASAFLNGGKPILSTKLADEMLSPQSKGYGLGWILDEPGQFSHWGSSGTLIWGDSKSGVVGVLFIQLQDLKLVGDIHRRFRSTVTQVLSKP